MKILFNYCSQPRAYADSVGYCLVSVEEGDDVESIKKEFHQERQWYEQTYLFEKQVSEYAEHTYKGDIIHKGKLLLFKTRSPYLD